MVQNNSKPRKSRSQKEQNSATAQVRVDALKKQKRLRFIELQLANLRSERKQLQQGS